MSNEPPNNESDQRQEKGEGLAFGGSGTSLLYLTSTARSNRKAVDDFAGAFRVAVKAYGGDLERAHYESEKVKAEVLKKVNGFAYRAYLMCGLADLLFEVSHNNFRFTHYLQRELTTLSAMRSSWFHLVPYRDYAFSGDMPPGESPLLFQVFLRLSMNPYRAKKGCTPLQFAQRLTENGLLPLLQKAKEHGFYLDLHTSLGWADCVLSGHFTGDRESYRWFASEIDRIGYTIDGEFDSFHRRRLTLVGFQTHENEKVIEHDFSASRRHFSPTVLARFKPGRLREAKEALVTYARNLGFQEDAEEPQLLYVDGKWDLVWQAGEATTRLGEVIEAIKANMDFYGRAKEGAAETSRPAAAQPLTRIESHLLPFPLGDVTTDHLSVSDLVSDNKQVRSRLDQRIEEVWRRVRKLPIASPLLNEIDSHLSIFSSLVADDDNRRSVDYVLHGAIDALFELAEHLDYLATLLVDFQAEDGGLENSSDELSPAERAQRYQSTDALYTELQEYLVNWCRLVGAAIQQRVAGSFENLFDRALSAPAMRGTLQKMLSVMDGLAREFFGILPYELVKIEDTDDYARAPRLVSVFTPTTRICSHRFLELIEIPARYNFSPHQVLPQLWHEVAEAVFLRRFNPMTSPLKMLLEEVFPDRHRAAFRQLGDHFSDLLVLRYGFQDRFEVFASSLIRTVIFSEREFLTINQELETVNRPRLDNLLSHLLGRLAVLPANVGDGEGYVGSDLEGLRKFIAKTAKEQFGRLFPPNDALPEIEFPDWWGNRAAIQPFIELVFKTINISVTRKSSRKESVGVRHITRESAPALFGRLEKGELCDLLSCRCGEKKCECKDRATLVNEMMLYYYECDLNRTPRLELPELSAFGFSALQAFRGSDLDYERAVEVRVARRKASDDLSRKPNETIPNHAQRAVDEPR